MLRTLSTVIIITGASLQGYSQTKNFIEEPYLETFAQVDTAGTIHGTWTLVPFNN